MVVLIYGYLSLVEISFFFLNLQNAKFVIFTQITPISREIRTFRVNNREFSNFSRNILVF